MKRHRGTYILFIVLFCSLAVANADMAMEVNLALENNVEEIQEKIEWLGSTHAYGSACIRITNGKVMYIDPSCLSAEQTNVKADLILVTHSHDDHFSIKTLQDLCKETTTIIAPKDCHDKLIKASLESNVIILSPGDNVTVDNMPIEAVPAYNLESSAHPRANGWLGYIATIEGTRIYHSGDTSFIPEMKELNNIDIAIVTVRNHYMMNGRQVVEAISSFRPKVVIPVHWLSPEESDIRYIQKHAPPGIKVLILDPSN
jgi:L-ascorbate metabolism protein UlaG (beta-lactamase superfamily)